MKLLRGIISLILLSVVLIGTAFCQISSPVPTPDTTMGWYFTIQPNTAGGPVTLIGPWPANWYAGAADVLGSMLYLHSFNCHLTGSATDCVPIYGNGMAYPKNYPWVSKGTTRVPLQFQIPGSGPIKLPLVGNPHQYGWYGLYYDRTSGLATVFPKAQWPKYKALIKAGKGIMPLYANNRCPGWPFFFVGSGPGQNDFACN